MPSSPYRHPDRECCRPSGGEPAQSCREEVAGLELDPSRRAPVIWGWGWGKGFLKELSPLGQRQRIGSSDTCPLGYTQAALTWQPLLF